MSVKEPIFGIDVHPRYQAGLDFERVAELGYEFVWVKASEAASYVPPGLRDYFRRAEASGALMGLYHFLTAGPSGAAQADHFADAVRSLGGPRGRLLCVDFEDYGRLSPTNDRLLAFVRRLKQVFPGHPVVVYSASGFWNGGDASGDFDRYGANALWEARYPDMARHDRPGDLYDGIADWGWRGFGGEKPVMWQFTSAGLVAGQYIDVNAFRLGMADLRSLAATALPNAEEEPPDPPANPSGSLMENVEKARRYGLALLEHRPRYWCWDGGNLNVPRPAAGRPAATDGPAPKPGSFSRMFCADLISFQMRLLGIPIPKNRFGDENYDGGTRSFRLRFGKAMRPFKASECRRGDVAFVDFQTSWAPEGHIGFCLGDGPDARFLQSHLDTPCAKGEPGLNADWTLAQSHDGGYYTHRIPREAIWGLAA